MLFMNEGERSMRDVAQTPENREDRAATGRRPLTLKGFSRITGYTVRQTKRAVEKGQVKTVQFADRDWIPASEADRVNSEKE
jgi:hypothetical protein